MLELTTLRIKSWNKEILRYPKSVRIKDLNTQKENFEDFEIISTLSGAVFDMMSFWWCCLTTNFQVQQDSHLRANRLSYFSMFQLMLAAVLASIQCSFHTIQNVAKGKKKFQDIYIIYIIVRRYSKVPNNWVDGIYVSVVLSLRKWVKIQNSDKICWPEQFHSSLKE